MGTAGFAIQLEFVKNFTKAFDIGPDAVQIAVTSFTNMTSVDFWFDDHGTKTGVVSAIDNIVRQSGAIRTQEALV